MVILPDVCRFNTGQTGSLHHGIRMLQPDIELGGFVITVGFYHAHIILVFGSYLLVILRNSIGYKSILM